MYINFPTGAPKHMTLWDPVYTRIVDGSSANWQRLSSTSAWSSVWRWRALLHSVWGGHEFSTTVLQSPCSEPRGGSSRIVARLVNWKLEVKRLFSGVYVWRISAQVVNSCKWWGSWSFGAFVFLTKTCVVGATDICSYSSSARCCSPTILFFVT